eukprot:8418093-Alexandrium_andersonii.AAC.1
MHCHVFGLRTLAIPEDEVLSEDEIEAKGMVFNALHPSLGQRAVAVSAADALQLQPAGPEPPSGAPAAKRSRGSNS